MWELIRANRRKSIALFLSMGLCLLTLGYVIGRALDPTGSAFNGGIFIALGIWAFMFIISFFAGDRLILTMSRAKEVTHDVHPQLFNVVEEMKISAGLPAMPKIYIINDPALNAFATGMKIDNSAIAVTAGLLSKLNRDELQGVVAHEMSHIVNRDVQFMTFAGILLGSIVLLSEIFLRSMFYSGSQSRRYKSGGRSGGQGQVIFLILAVVLAVLAPIFAKLLYFAISRKREYLADASAVRLTRYPQGLASALEKISGSSAVLAAANTATAPMYISNPLRKKERKAVNLGSTHPPIVERIRILRAMMSGADYSNYQKAYSSIIGAGGVVMPASALNNNEKIPVRQGTVSQDKPENASQTRKLGDIMMAVNSYVFIACLCGMKIKIPKGFRKKNILCPKCRREHKVPAAQLAKAVAGAVAGHSEETLGDRSAFADSYTRTGRGWESFNCGCGRLIQISPAFESSHIQCGNCGKRTEIIQHSTGG